MDWQWLLGLVLLVFLMGGSVLAAAREWGRFGRALRSFFRPEAPAVGINGVGARHSRERDETGWVKWGSVIPSYRIEVNQPEGIYDVQTGVENRATGERVAFSVHIPRIKGDDGIPISQDDAQIPRRWLDGYAGENPHRQVLYWVTARDDRRRRWEFVYDPETGTMRRPRRVSRRRGGRQAR